ncbi:hypothetical protein G6F46_000287 [Rhizopus delemar]|uniref:Glutamate carboxypeptidase II n=3 Tax=Rhizopus TaxID=4842 RepID=I1C0S4_RHIO9|nr:hypothetical protein RO3G_06759 [Rhizopus delemar RA 99-880]KAG1456709.1 hypothetical protein G6F55_006354 [Rhizopus delemar]KAG1541591.1 hypothetical protein G6F51_007800 [Rhizopus arrhizus]KAG1501814.1 hypothetical protein G6F54_002781 [Rhizopus delemar]KAG1513873.1 hypothetical protein G6F53_004105 [Rhizopus delemar]|eukprot:EIE82054.1 hypothetical protein RO3G_06759 [Rhizopus delemar RA 99-880]
MSGSIRLPNDDKNGYFKKAHNWLKNRWNSEPNERSPLLNDQQESKGKTKFRVIFSSISLLVALIILGLTIRHWFKHHDKEVDDGTPPPNWSFLTPTEQEFLDLPSNTSVREYLKIYTSKAHLAGTPNDQEQAEWTRDQFESFGLNTTIDTYWPLLNYPISHRFAIISGPEYLQYEAKLREDPVEEDETSKDPDVIPTFHGYSKNGTATGRVVYANYGRVEDFQFLKDHGIDLNGTIALVRYGGSFRGLKVKAAEVFGCAGVLIYSDPIDDGPLNKEEFPKSYPDGPWRSQSSAQRGSVQYLSLIAGDPLTPGYPALENVTRIDPEDSPGLAKIPSLPLSWEDALPILKATQGHGVRADKDWAGGLEGVDYFSGPTEGEAVLVNHIENKITPIWNVVARIEGAEEPKRAIVLGNHRDAWVYGAVDPSSGSAAMLELARAFGQLLKGGWRPRRTIILASWDAEEYGLVGSTEWVEENKDWLNEQAAVYINVDTAVSGPHFDTSASPSLNRLLYDIASLVEDPRTGGSVYDAWSADYKLSGNQRPPVGQLGSGSDFVAFMDHVGIASINLAFSGNYGVYHSNYDSFHWMEKFGDPDFRYHQTMVKIWGLLALRLSESLILPLHPADYAADLSKYVDNLSTYTSSLNYLPDAVDKLERTATRFERRLERLAGRLAKYDNLDDVPAHLIQRLEKANKRLTYFERGFIDPEGIPGRTWFKHVVYAPGLWTGYSSQVFPAIMDSVNAKNDKLVAHTETRAAKSIEKAAEYLKMK